MGPAATLTSLGNVLNGTVNNSAGGSVESVFTLATHLSFFVVPVLVDLAFVFAPLINNSVRTILMHSRVGEFASEESGAVGHVLVSGA